MKNHRYIAPFTYLWCLAFFLSSVVSIAQLSKTHYIPPLTSAEFGNANPENQYLYLSTPSLTDVAYTIIPVGQPESSYIKGVVSNANSREIFLGTGNGQLFIPSPQTSRVVNDRGYIIEAQGTIYASLRMQAGSSNQAGALVSKGLTALGTTFRVGTYTNENPQTNYLNFVSVMATEDDTQVTFSDLPAGIVIKNYNGSTPITVTLDKGESYTIATNSAESVVNWDGLIGTLVTSDLPIVVNCGSANGSFHNGGGRDYGIDQIADLSKVGTEYIFVRGDGSNRWENILIVAHYDNTSIRINGNTPVATIDAGEYYLIEGEQYSSRGNMFVETSKDVFAYQGVGGNANEANQGMFFVPPLSCESRGSLDNIAAITRIGNTTYTGGITIVTRVGATVTINNTPIASFNVVGPFTVTGNADYVTYKVLNLNGNVSVQSTDELYCAYFNVNGAATSGSFYSGFPSAPEINFDTQFTTLGNCIPNLTLDAANIQNFDSIAWWFDNGSGFVNTGITTATFSPTNPGRYKLIGTITCSGLELESAEIPVSICPSDMDNDGIIDNLDIDKDNDGILNCTESNGNAVLDFSNEINPVLNFTDNSTNSSIATAIVQNTGSGTTGTIQGDSTGLLTSTIPTGIDGQNTYELSFNEPVHIKITESTTTGLPAIDGAFFQLNVSPSGKNITLVDPDDRLLIDSNFDGVYEEGVTLISGSEIRYIANPNPNGSTPYIFYGDSIDGISLTHDIINTSAVSSYSALFSLTCFNKDTDGDGFSDAVDQDSDNDSIPDYVENQGVVITLSGVDANLDGLDDIFNSTDVPIDSDLDGIFDFYDLDSDNDGIYDLQESGSTSLDLNLDGLIDNAVLLLGNNGWDNTAESAPDSNLLGYTVLDIDANGIFNYRDLDSDGDNCFDVIEAGYSDGNSDGLIGINVMVNDQGVVTSSTTGYQIPNPNVIIGAPILISVQPQETIVCENDTSTITIDANADRYQWQVSLDGVSWSSITDDATYSNSQTESLTVSDATLILNGNRYRVLLERDGNTCGLESQSILLTVNALPILNTSVNLIQCDDDIDGVSFFNLMEANHEISANASNETFTFYTTSAAALLGDPTSADYIATPMAYENSNSPNAALVYARVTSSEGCSSIAPLNLQVGTSQIPAGSIQEVINVCDDFLDVNGLDNANNDDRDGVSSFDLSYLEPLVANFFLPQTPNIAFYRNEADALAENNPITNLANYRNIGYPNSQQIYIRVDSEIGNDCQAFGPYVTLNVEALPVANEVTISRQCDQDPNDGIIDFSFDTSTIENQLLGVQDPATVNISYIDSNGGILPSPLPNPFVTESQTITARVTNRTTADPAGACFDETNIDFIVDAQPIANPVPAFIVCDGDAGDNDTDGLFDFDTSTISSTILSGQTGMEITYTFINQSGNVTTQSQLPNPFTSGNQTVTVDVINPTNPSCNAQTFFDFVVNPLPQFSINEEETICAAGPLSTVLLDPQEANLLENYTYSWDLDGTTVATTPTLIATVPGTYTVTLSKLDGTGCSRSRQIIVTASELPEIDRSDILIEDLRDSNRVEILNPEELGLGNYQFSLISRDNDRSFPFQTNPVFENVDAGFYDLIIDDLEGCGSITVSIAVIGYPKFFTPNNDGFNDRWQIEGINALNQESSTIFIFDRYGKLLKQLIPGDDGWDGTFNNNPLPSSDYWFKVTLQDGRSFSGNFTLKR